jgi:inorganic pyrophosphatase
MDPARGGDGDALDVLILGQSVASGTVLEFIPIGLLKLRDAGEVDTKVIGVPLAEDQQVMDISSFQDLLIHYDSARRIIEEWFLHYKGYGVMDVEGWEDEAVARTYIQDWSR